MTNESGDDGCTVRPCFICVVCLCVFCTASTSSMCWLMLQHTATGKVTLCLISSQQRGKTILYLQSPCHFKFSIAAGTQTRYLRFLGIGSFRKAAVCATAYRVPALTPQLQLYRSAQCLHTSGIGETRRMPHGPWPALPPSLSPHMASQASPLPLDHTMKDGSMT